MRLLAEAYPLICFVSGRGFHKQVLRKKLSATKFQIFTKMSNIYIQEPPTNGKVRNSHTWLGKISGRIIRKLSEMRQLL